MVGIYFETSTGYKVSNRPDLGGIILVLLENPKSGLDLSRDMKIPILKISSHKPTNRERYFVKSSYLPYSVLSECKATERLQMNRGRNCAVQFFRPL